MSDAWEISGDLSPTSADTNADGVSDLYEEIFLTTATGPGVDADGDGLTTQNEALHGTAHILAWPTQMQMALSTEKKSVVG